MLITQNQDDSGNRHQILNKILWLRISMLSIAVFVIWFFNNILERELNLKLLLVIVTAGYVYSAISYIRLSKAIPITDTETFIQLCLDATILVLLVAFSGGATNPFIYYYLVLVCIAAAVFQQSLAWLFCSTSILTYSGLLYSDLSGHAHHGFSDFQLHLVGMWFNFVSSAVLLCFFISRFATALRDRERRLAQSRQKNLANEQLVAIATLAASTAHHLGTPLSTMAIILDEMDVDADAVIIKNDLGILKTQVSRCKDTLEKLTLLAETNEHVTLIKDLIHEVQAHYAIANPRVQPDFQININEHTDAINTDLLLRHAIINLIDNAIRAAKNKVNVNVASKQQTLTIYIKDDGDGFPDHIIENWGNPNTSKQRNGIGIGIFLANYTIENAGGNVTAINKTNDQMTHVIINIPLDANT